MSERVITEVVPLRNNSSHKFWIRLSINSNNEERRMNIFSLKNIEYFRCPDWIGTVVKSESHKSRTIARSLNHVARRNLQISFGRY